jgi:hypothetical protein
MIKKTITYVDYDGVSRTEDFYFNLTTAEVTELELSVTGGLVKTIDALVQAKDGAKILELFKNVIKQAHGIKSPDGRRFIKSQAIFEEFAQTEAYSKLFMELATDADKAAEFVNGALPKELVQPTDQPTRK